MFRSDKVVQYDLPGISGFRERCATEETEESPE